MSHYRKIDVRVWNDANFMSLNTHGQLAWFMLLTHPMMTSLGAIRATPDGLAAELAKGDEALRKAFQEAFREVIDKGMADYDPKANLLALPNFLKYNKPENPNVVKAWASAAEMLPECDLKDLTIQRSIKYAEALGSSFRDGALKAFGKSYPKAFAKALPIQRTEKQRAESRDLRSAYDKKGNLSEVVNTRETMFTALPIPSSPAEGRDFLSSKGVKADKMNECLERLLGGNLTPYDLEGVVDDRSAA